MIKFIARFKIVYSLNNEDDNWYTYGYYRLSFRVDDMYDNIAKVIKHADETFNKRMEHEFERIKREYNALDVKAIRLKHNYYELKEVDPRIEFLGIDKVDGDGYDV